MFFSCILLIQGIDTDMNKKHDKQQTITIAAAPMGNGSSSSSGGGGGNGINNENTLFILHRSHFTAYLMTIPYRLKLTDCSLEFDPPTPARFAKEMCISVVEGCVNYTAYHMTIGTLGLMIFRWKTN